MKKSVKKLLALGLGVVLAVGVVGCGQAKKEAKSDSKTESNELKTIRIGAIGQGNQLGGAVGYAESKGYLKEELEKAGYTPEIVGFAQAGPAINEAFAAGNIDVAIYGDLPATVAKSNGTDTTIFANHNSEMQMGIFLRKGVEDVTSAKDFPGHKVIVARGTIYHQYFKSLINDAGVKEDEIEEINTFSDAASLISSGDADVLITSTSIAYYLESLGLGSLIEDTSAHEEWTSQFFGVGLSAYLKENGEAAKAIIKSMIRAQEEISEDPTEAYQIWAEKSNGYTADIYEKEAAYDTSFSYVSPELTENTKTKLKKLNEFLLAEGLITNAVDVDNFVDNSYYEAAKAEYEESK